MIIYNQKFINNPLSNRNEMTLEGIKQFFIQIDKEEWKFETLCDIYNTLTITQSIIFCSNREKCIWLANKMIENQFTVVYMQENMNQQERDHRIGRTSKFRRMSIAINFLIQEDNKMLNEIEQYYQTKIEEMPINFTDFFMKSY